MKIKPDNISTPQGRHVHRSYFKHTTFFFKLHTLLTTVCRPRNTHPIQEHQKRYKWHYKGWSSEHQKILSLHGKSFLLGAWFLKIKLIPEYSWMQLDLFWILTSCRESAIFLVSQRPTGHMLNKALPWHPGSWATRGPAAPSCPQLVVEEAAGLLPKSNNRQRQPKSLLHPTAHAIEMREQHQLKCANNINRKMNN